jgi:amidase
VGTPVSVEAELAIKHTISVLSRLGHELTEVAWPFDGRALIESYYVMNGAETSAMFADLQQGLQRKLTIDDMELISWGLYRYGETLPVKKYIHALHLWDSTTMKMEALFSEYDLLLTPTAADAAPRIDQEFQSDDIRAALRNAENLNEKELEQLVSDMFEAGLTLTPYTQLANLTGQPAISLPMYLTQSGLPFGVQFMASKGREDLLLAVGKQLEEQQVFKLPEFYRAR